MMIIGMINASICFCFSIYNLGYSKTYIHVGHFFLIFMNKFEYSRVVKRYSLKPWRYEYYKFMYRLGHSGEFEKILLRSLVALSALSSGIFTLLIIFDFQISPNLDERNSQSYLLLLFLNFIYQKKQTFLLLLRIWHDRCQHVGNIKQIIHHAKNQIL